MSPQAAWRRERPGPLPYKHDRVPWFVLPHGSDPRCIYPDTCHTFHIGFGADMVASTIVLLCKLTLFGQARSLDARWLEAYRQFMSAMRTKATLRANRGAGRRLT